MEDQAVLAFKRFGEAATATGLAMKPLVMAFSQFGAAVYAIMWDAYIRAGAPYGETRKGLERWLRDVKDLRKVIYNG
jgi:hypothetical protein